MILILQMSWKKDLAYHPVALVTLLSCTFRMQMVLKSMIFGFCYVSLFLTDINHYFLTDINHYFLYEMLYGILSLKLVICYKQLHDVLHLNHNRNFICTANIETF